MTVHVIEPATEEVLAELPQAGIDETDAAVERARAAFPAWHRIAPGERAALLRRAATLVRECVWRERSTPACCRSTRTRRCA
jgi:acyl-CoA reductase-like NAD-dependent aldehyde dehydrogenase